MMWNKIKSNWKYIVGGLLSILALIGLATSQSNKNKTAKIKDKINDANQTAAVAEGKSAAIEAEKEEATKQTKKAKADSKDSLDKVAEAKQPREKKNQSTKSAKNNILSKT